MNPGAKGFIVGVAKVGKHFRWFLCWDEVTREGVLATGATFSEKDALPKAFKAAKKLYTKSKLPAEASTAISGGTLGETKVVQYEGRDLLTIAPEKSEKANDE